MKRLSIISAIAIFLLSATPATAQIDSATFNKLVEQVTKLDKKMAKMEKGLVAKIGAVQTDLDNYKNPTNQSISDLRGKISGVQLNLDTTNILLGQFVDTTYKNLRELKEGQNELTQSVESKTSGFWIWVIILTLLIGLFALILHLAKNMAPTSATDKRSFFERLGDAFKEAWNG